MFTVGIISPVVIESVSKNEDNVLEISMKKTAGGSVLDVFNSTSDSSAAGEESNNFRIFNQLKPLGYGDKELTGKEISSAINQFKDQLNHILLHFKPSSEIKWDVTAGTGITPANLESKLKQQGTLDLIYSNIVKQFIKNMEGADLSKAFHLKTVRQSKDKHYAKFPQSSFGYSGANAFIQDASLPCTLKYSKYELGYRKGDAEGAPSAYDASSPAQVVADAPITAEQSAEQTGAVNSIFG